MLLEELAYELVDVTSRLLDGRTVNVMNTQGVIIASTEPYRIGTFHQGALEAAVSGQPVSITKAQLMDYPGAKEGYNMPLRVDNTVIGVVGIFGDPEEIRYVAHMVELYAEKYYQLESLIRPQYAAGALRTILLGKLLEISEEKYTEALALMKSENIQLQLPVKVVLYSPLESPETSQALVGKLLQTGRLNRSHDIWGMVGSRLVMLLSDLPERSTLEKESGLHISVSTPAATLWDIHAAYEQALILDAICVAPINTLDDHNVRCRYMLYCNAATHAGFLDAMYQKLSDVFTPQECLTVLLSGQAYYECDRSVTKAASQLYIHKNTLQYRLHRLWNALDLNNCSDFQQEYYIRLLLEHYKRKQGLRALK